MTDQPYQMCVRCIMDTSDPEITFDEEGVCSHCHTFDDSLGKTWLPNGEGRKILDGMIAEIKKAGQGKEYDCALGLSGGVDSSYLAYLAVKDFGLRPLAVHVDGGWNSPEAVRNIENIVKALDIDLFTYVIDWEEMRDLQAAFLKAGVANQDTPQDHAFFAKLFEFAVKNDIKYVLSGHNIATESVLPTAWGYNPRDDRQIKGIHKRFGSGKLKTFPIASIFKYFIYFPHIKGMKVLNPLNYVPYDKAKAMDVLKGELGWRYYGGKHFESRFTKFFQAYWLPEKFGFDKRRAHLSSLILSGQISREEALTEIEKPAYPPEQFEEDKEFIRKKLGFGAEEFEALMTAPTHSHLEYPSYVWLVNLRRKIRRWRNGE